MRDIPLRERKYAATKASLMQALVARLSRQSLYEIAVKDICNDAQVSETTFFNYFPSKHDVIGYRIQLWSIAVKWQMEQQLAHGKGHLEAIRILFDLTAQAEAKTPGVMREVVAFQVSQKLSFQPLTLAEYAYHFPDTPGIAEIQAESVDQMLGAQLRAAQESAELATDLDLEALNVILMGVFFLTPIIIGHSGSLRDAYRRQLKIVLPG